jgi:hypothetical protein
MVGLLIAMTLVGITAVVIRVDQTRISQRIQECQIAEMELRRGLWAQDAELAQLRSPREVRERAEKLGLTTAADPGKTPTSKGMTSVKVKREGKGRP